MLISADLPVFVTKLCELFIQELMLRARVFAQSQNRNILLDIDIVNAIANTESYHFLANVVRHHQLAKLTMSNTTVAKRHWPNKMNLSYHHTQTINVSLLVDCLPFVGISPMALMGAHRTESPTMLMMQEKVLPRDDKAKFTFNGPPVTINKMCRRCDSLRNKKHINANTFVGDNSNATWVSPHLLGGKGDLVSITSACDTKKMNNLRSIDSLNVVIDTSSRDAATVNHQGRTTQPISFKDTCASLEDNYVVSNPVGHDDITGTGDDDDVNQLWNEEKNYGVHFLGEGNFPKSLCMTGLWGEL
uniref:Transcription factor CBF/NF-Y/archaeal histone domain-containing protein n=1 Tax=Leersia perrieri TaxID=77586 RepID=A0A0D9XID8_9ORYZ